MVHLRDLRTCSVKNRTPLSKTGYLFSKCAELLLSLAAYHRWLAAIGTRLSMFIPAGMLLVISVESQFFGDQDKRQTFDGESQVINSRKPVND